MAKHYEVLNMLIPNGGYVQSGEDYEGIDFVECEPITKEEYEAGFAKFESWKLAQDEKKASSKAALLNKLGISEDEAKLLLG
jgi:hypothetical protein